MSEGEERPQNFIHDGAKSTQEAYYEFKLRQEKLSAIATKGVADNWLSAEEKTALDGIGEREKLETKILARLYGLADSSAELLQVKALTNCKSREDCAKTLAEKYYRKITTEEVLNRFVAPSTAKARIIDAARTASARNYTAWGANQ